MPKKAKKPVVKSVKNLKNMTQTVILNLGKRNVRKKSSAPTAQKPPSAFQQAMMMVAMMRSPPTPADPMFQSTRILNQLLEPTNRRLDALLLGQPVPTNQAVSPPVTQPTPQTIHSEPGRRDQVLDLPDEPLIRPTPPLVPAGPERMDEPHESISLAGVDEPVSASSPSSSSADPYEQYYNRNALSKLPIESRNNDAVTITKIASHLGVSNRFVNEYGERKKYSKEELIGRILSHLG
jgi:hypothetical protein